MTTAEEIIYGALWELYNATLEDAAKIADSFNPKDTHFESEIGTRIRALKGKP